MFERAIAILKQNMLLHFAYADFEESHLKYERVHQIYNDYLDQKQIDPTLVRSGDGRVEFWWHFLWLFLFCFISFQGVYSVYEIRSKSRRY